MAEWIHCNLCGRQPPDGVKLFLASCSHMFCNRCKDKGTLPHCAICQKSCTFTELNDKLDNHLQVYFLSPYDQVKKQVEVMKFQKQHQSMLFKQMRKKIERYEVMVKKAETYFQKVNEENRSLKLKLKNAEDEIQQLKYDKSILKKYIGAYKAYESGSSHQKPMTPCQLLRSPSIVSPRPLNPQGQGHVVMASSHGRSHTSPATPFATPSRQLMEIQNTPTIARMSVRRPPSNGKMGTPSQPISRNSPAYSNRIQSPVVGVENSPRQPYSKVNRHRGDSLSHFSAFHSRTPNLIQTLDNQNADRSPFPQNRRASSCAEPVENTCASAMKSATSSANVSSKYFSRTDRTPSCSPMQTTGLTSYGSRSPFDRSATTKLIK